jgi:hypothetical protein
VIDHSLVALYQGEQAAMEAWSFAVEGRPQRVMLNCSKTNSTSTT